MNLEYAKYLAEYDPEKYIGLELYKDPRLKELTERFVDRFVQDTGGNFFYYRLDKIPEFKKYEKRAAMFVAARNPIAAILIYNLHQKSELRSDVEFAETLLTSLVKEFGGNVNDFQNISENLKDPKILKVLEQLIETIVKQDPKFYQSSGLAEDPEFGKFFSHIGKGENDV